MTPEDARDIRLEDLSLTIRTFNCLRRAGIHTVGGLISRSEQDLMEMINFGERSLQEVTGKLAGLDLALSETPWRETPEGRQRRADDTTTLAGLAHARRMEELRLELEIAGQHDEFTTRLDRIAVALERIAVALEKS